MIFTARLWAIELFVRDFQRGERRLIGPQVVVVQEIQSASVRSRPVSQCHYEQ